MKNLAADMEQITAKYQIKPEHFRIYLYIAQDKTVIIIAKKDNNFTEWLSIGKLSKHNNKIGECVKYLFEFSPLPTSTSLYWKPNEEHTKMKLNELYVFYKQITFAKNGKDLISVNGHDLSKDISGEEIQQLIWQFYSKDLEKLSSFTEEELEDIIHAIKKDITDIKHLQEKCPPASVLGLEYISNEANGKFNSKKSKYLFCQNNTIKHLLFELYQLACDSYNEYMTMAR